jgi:ribosomal protein S6
MEQEKTQEKGDTMTVYEVSYLLLPSLANEQVPREIASIKEAIISRGGAVLTGEDPVLIDLAYSMTKVVQTVRHKAKTAYFGWTKFEMTPEGIEAVKKALDADQNVLRYLIIKTVRENTLLLGKMKLAKEDSSKREDSEVDEVPEVLKEASSEELDKSIDELVVV